MSDLINIFQLIQTVSRVIRNDEIYLIFMLLIAYLYTEHTCSTMLPALTHVYNFN